MTTFGDLERQRIGKEIDRNARRTKNFLIAFRELEYVLLFTKDIFGGSDIFFEEISEDGQVIISVDCSHHRDDTKSVVDKEVRWARELSQRRITPIYVLSTHFGESDVIPTSPASDEGRVDGDSQGA